jgi:hypothetical protein
MRPCLLDFVGDIGEVAHGAPKPVQARDDEHVAFAQN